MTVSGRVSGAEKGTDDNLRRGSEPLFAAYLARVVDELQRRHRIAFRTLSPVNEPNTDYWFAANRQEGAHWDPARQAAMIDATAAALRARGLATTVSAPDETNSSLLLEDWAAYPPATRARISQINVHSYRTVHQTGVRDAARAQGIRLWMSENDTPAEKTPEDFADMRSALAFAEHVVNDLKRLEPAAWIFWQAVEDVSARNGAAGSNWGLVKTDLTAPPSAPHHIAITAKYWAMASFSRYIRPGMRLLPVDDPDTAGAVGDDGREIVLVHVNGGLSPRRILVRLPGSWRAEVIETDADHHAERVATTDRAPLLITAPSRAITTIRLKRR
jgi:O-glycosyl hydrolase